MFQFHHLLPEFTAVEMPRDAIIAKVHGRMLKHKRGLGSIGWDSAIGLPTDPLSSVEANSSGLRWRGL